MTKMASPHLSVQRLLAVAMCFQCILAKKVLILSVQMGGHTSEFGIVAKQLMEKGDYEIHAAWDENLEPPAIFRTAGIKILRYRSPDKANVDIKDFDRRMSQAAFATSDTGPLYEISRPRLNLDCALLLNDTDLYRRFEAEKYDLALVDSMLYCYHLIPYRLGIPFISLSAYQFPLVTRMFPLSAGLSCFKTPENIFERFKNVLEALKVDSLPSVDIDESKFLRYIPGKKLNSLREVAMQSKLWIMAAGNTLDCPKATHPNVILAGGMNTKPSKPLPSDLLKYVDSAKEGVVIVSFGSMLSNPPKYFKDKLLKAFGSVPQKVIWRLSKEASQDLEVPKNVKVMQWLPQNDLLGHSNVKLFITHCGNNGQWESFYHSVPMIGIPMFGDQFPNADRLLVHKIGLVLNAWTFTADDLKNAISEITGNKSYSDNIHRLSAIFKNLPEHPSKTAAFWVDHVIRFGSAHLRSAAFGMPEYQFYMVDVMLMFFSLVVCIVIFVGCLIRMFVKMLPRGDKLKKA